MAQNISKSIKINAKISVIHQIVTVACGLILPRLILSNFGSNYNGLTSSITQFTSCITLLSAGIGGVTRAALYKPLAENNTNEISIIVCTTQAFMRKIGLIFAAFISIFAVIYPLIINNEFPWLFSATLILIISASTFISSYFGIAFQLLLRADQKNYIFLLVQIGAIILNTFISALLINMGCGIHIVKASTAIIYSIQPIIILIYCKHHYSLDMHAKVNNTYLAQRWDAFAQRIALFVHSNTDIMLITIFLSLSKVSIYSVYSYAILGIEQVIKSIGIGVDAAFGKLLIKGPNANLNRSFSRVEYVIYSLSTILFTVTAMMIIPFALLYTKDIVDTDYYQPLFAYLFIIAEFLFCIRMPYQDIIEAKGVFKDLKRGSIIEMIINLVVSLLLVNKLGVVGVAIGTISAMVYRNIEYIIYLKRNILYRSCWLFIKRLIMSILVTSISIVICNLIMNYECPIILIWVIKACITTLIVGIVWVIISLVFERSLFLDFISFIGLRRKGKSEKNS